VKLTGRTSWSDPAGQSSRRRPSPPRTARCAQGEKGLLTSDDWCAGKTSMRPGLVVAVTTAT